MNESFYFQRDLLLKNSINETSISHELPPLVIRTSLKRGLSKKEDLLPAAFFLEMISGQKPIGCRAKRSYIQFKVRQNDIVGWQVTLRGAKLHSFLTKWTNAILPVERNLYRITNLSSFLELNEQILPEHLLIHISFEAHSKERSNLLLSNYNFPMNWVVKK